MQTRARADAIVFGQGLAESVAHAASLIMAGRVAIDSGKPEPQKVAKPGQQFPLATRFIILPGKLWASRGALKLLSVIDSCPERVRDKICIDAGASTGGFTDCLLARGAQKVYAIDVGRNLLHEKLRADTRVVNLEGVNLRTAPPDLLPEKARFLACDLSFISLTLCVPRFLPWLEPGALLALLVKPQFELAPNEMICGVVRDESLRQKAVRKIINFCVEACGLNFLRSEAAPIKGPAGNQEYITLFETPKTE